MLINLMQKLQRGSALVAVDIGKLQDVYQKLATSLKDKVRWPSSQENACCCQHIICAVPTSIVFQFLMVQLTCRLMQLLHVCGCACCCYGCRHDIWLVTVSTSLSKEGCHGAWFIGL